MPKGSEGQTVQEGLQDILQAIAKASSAPDAAPMLQQLQMLNQAVLALIHAGGGQSQAQQSGAGQQPPAQPPGAGLMAQAPQPQGPGGTGGSSMSGASSDSLRQMVGSTA